MMKNRMQDLDFEQTVAFDSVKDFEFTRRAAQRFRQVVSLDGFEDEDADVIFHYLYKEMELVSFGDHLKRYIYERAGIEEPFGEVPQEMCIRDRFKPFVMKELVANGTSHNIKNAKKMVEKLEPAVWDVLEDVIKEHPVMLNRAPTPVSYTHLDVYKRQRLLRVRTSV